MTPHSADLIIITNCARCPRSINISKNPASQVKAGTFPKFPGMVMRLADYMTNTMKCLFSCSLFHIYRTAVDHLGTQSKGAESGVFSIAASERFDFIHPSVIIYEIYTGTDIWTKPSEWSLPLYCDCEVTGTSSSLITGVQIGLVFAEPHVGVSSILCLCLWKISSKLY